MPEPARFVDGFPDNLPAAALDALEWLEVFRHSPLLAKRPEDRERLERCVTALREQVAPHLSATEATQ